MRPVGIRKSFPSKWGTTLVGLGFIKLGFGQNRIHAPYVTVYMVIFLPKMPYIHRIYMVLANPTHSMKSLPKILHVHRIYRALKLYIIS